MQDYFCMINDKVARENDYNKETSDSIYFFTPRFYAFDNFSAYAVEVWGMKFPTSEHAYQWRKYKDTYPELALEIFNATSAYKTKKIADANRDKVLSTQNEKIQFMETILRAKTEQHEKVRKLLLESGEKTIIENSPDDEFWGIGSGNGQNMLGKLWMKIRDEIKNQDKVI